MQTSNAKQLAQSASAIGGAILGFGLGAKWGFPIQAYAIAVIIVGAIIHTWGMYLTQIKDSAMQRERTAKLLWLSAWICLAALLALVLYLVLAR